MPTGGLRAMILFFLLILFSGALIGGCGRGLRP